MRRLIAGTMTAGVLLLSPRPTEAALAGEDCPAVYIDTPAVIPHTLTDAIDNLGRNGTAAHVQIFRDGRTHDIHEPTAEADAQTYAQRLEERCGWSDALNVTISETPQVLKVRLAGHISVNAAAVEQAKSNLKADLETPAQPPLFDVAKFFKVVDPGPQEATPMQRTIKGIAAVAALALGLCGLRIGQGRRLKKLWLENGAPVPDKLARLSDLVTSLGRADFAGINEAGMPVSTIEVDKQSRSYADAQRQLLQDYQKERKRLLPNVQWVRRRAAKIAQLDPGIDDLLHPMEDTLKRLAAAGVAIDTQVAEFRGVLESAEGTLAALKARGWAVGGYEQRLAGLQGVSGKIGDLRAQRRLQEPAELTVSAMQPALTLKTEISNLAKRRATADERYNGQSPRLKEARLVGKGTKFMIAILMKGCQLRERAEIGQASAELDALVAELAEIQSSGGSHKAEQNVPQLEESEKLNNRFDGLYCSTRALITRIGNDFYNLIEAETAAPGGADNLNKFFRNTSRAAQPTLTPVQEA